MSVNDLVTWFKGRPKWIQEAVNRLLEKDDLSEELSALQASC
jgi:hypothetical protein